MALDRKILRARAISRPDRVQNRAIGLNRDASHCFDVDRHIRQDVLFPRSATVVGAEHLALASAEVNLAWIDLVDGYAECGASG